jgi:hypothetical protein
MKKFRLRPAEGMICILYFLQHEQVDYSYSHKDARTRVITNTDYRCIDEAKKGHEESGCEMNGKGAKW